ncbi:MAG: glycosyltransferase [Nitrospiraceae bacterium]
MVLAELAGSAAYGGGERYLELLMCRLDRTRFRPLVICPEPGPFMEFMEERGVPARLVHLAPLVNPVALVRLVGLLARERVGVLQTHGLRSSAYGCLAGRLAGVPVIIATIHNSLQDYPISTPKRWIYRAILRRVIRLADRIICVSEDLRQDMMANVACVPDRTVTIHNGIDLTALNQPGDRSAIRTEFQVGPGPLLVAIGRLTEQKGHRYLVHALPHLLAEWPHLKCLIVGQGELEQTIAAEADRLGVGGCCRFAGLRRDVPAILAAADLVVLPSVSEGFPFVLLEALAVGCPVVASRVNGVPELVEHASTGRLVPPRDPHALAREIREVLRDPARAAEMARRGAQVVRDRFTAERMAAQTVALFEGTLRERQVATAAPQGAHG